MPAAHDPEKILSASADLKRVIKAFDASWRRGETPDLAAYLDHPTLDGALLRLTLALRDMEWRHGRGEVVAVEAYLDRFVELKRDRSAHAKLARQARSGSRAQTRGQGGATAAKRAKPLSSAPPRNESIKPASTVWPAAKLPARPARRRRIVLALGGVVMAVATGSAGWWLYEQWAAASEAAARVPFLLEKAEEYLRGPPGRRRCDDADRRRGTG